MKEGWNFFNIFSFWIFERGVELLSIKKMLHYEKKQNNVEYTKYMQHKQFHS